ncbi:TonB family protein [Duganella sp. Root198D2]|uniref:TonB family protein n=1 Tax=Duganella sp. Root198D2 TaxID=1736489 RepID=UPI0009E7CEC1|nr:TonB family protein [Duganella sp. Root198D2]
MTLLKLLPALLAGLAILPAQADTVGRTDRTAAKQISADLKTCAKPEWPKEALRNEQVGTVTLAFLVGLDGKVLESRVEKSSGHAQLDLAAQDGLAKCQFTPPESVGRTEPTWTRMQYVWTLETKRTPQQLQVEFEKNKVLAAQGDADAMYRLSNIYANRRGAERNIEESMRWLRKSAELGHPIAQEALGYVLITGKDTPRNPEEGWAWTEKAAAQGRSQSQMALGVSLLSGMAGVQDQQRGRELLEKSIAQGNPMAMGALGAWLVREGVEPQLGLKLLEDGAGKQDRMAQFALGEVLEKGELLPQDNARALELYKRSAAGGYSPAIRAQARLQPPPQKK